MNKNCDSVVGQEPGPNAMEGEEVNNGLKKIQVKQKRKKWKHQARQLKGKKIETSKSVLEKRQSCEMGWLSPQPKRSKMLNPNKLANIEYSYNSPRAKIKLKWGAHNTNDMEISTTIAEESTAEAGSQPC